VARWSVAEIKVQRKEKGSRKWAWLFLLVIPVIWFVMKSGGDDKADAATSDSAKAAAAKADSVKKP
jgi:hypothetical protein